MLHAVKYLLIAMQFPQVHKKELYDDDVEFGLCLSVRKNRTTWIELSNRYKTVLTIS